MVTVASSRRAAMPLAHVSIGGEVAAELAAANALTSAASSYAAALVAYYV
jgi:hypothetical protein